MKKPETIADLANKIETIEIEDSGVEPFDIALTDGTVFHITRRYVSPKEWDWINENEKKSIKKLYIDEPEADAICGGSVEDIRLLSAKEEKDRIPKAKLENLPATIVHQIKKILIEKFRDNQTARIKKNLSAAGKSEK